MKDHKMDNTVLEHPERQELMFNFGDPMLNYIIHLLLLLNCICVTLMDQTNGLAFLMPTWQFQSYSLLYLDWLPQLQEQFTPML